MEALLAELRADHGSNIYHTRRHQGNNHYSRLRNTGGWTTHSMGGWTREGGGNLTCSSMDWSPRPGALARQLNAAGLTSSSSASRLESSDEGERRKSSLTQAAGAAVKRRRQAIGCSRSAAGLAGWIQC